MAITPQPVKPGLSAPKVGSIPDTWDPQWFRRFITNFLGGSGGGGGDIQTELDSIDSTEGAVLYRGPTEWDGLNPGTAGFVLATGGPGAIPSWVSGPPGEWSRGAAWTNGALPIFPANALDVPLIIPADCTILDVTLLTKGGTGSCVVDIWKVPYGAYPPTSANSICGTNKPTITADIKYRDLGLATWSTALSLGDTLMFHLESTSVFTDVTVLITLQIFGPSGTSYTDARAIAAVEGALVDSSTITFAGSTGGVVTAATIPGGGASATNPFMKTGTVARNNDTSTSTIAFAPAFPNACLWVFLTSKSAGASDGSIPQLFSVPTASGFTFGFNDTAGTSVGATTVGWLAIGY